MSVPVFQRLYQKLALGWRFYSFSSEKSFRPTREHLINQIRKLEANNENLRKFIEKRSSSVAQKVTTGLAPKVNRRYIALLVSYIGWDESREEEFNISDSLRSALIKTNLVDEDEKVDIRSGDVALGVSAVDQILALRLKTNLGKGVGVEVTGDAAFGKTGDDEEIRYPLVLNKALPGSVRVLAWAPITADYDPRIGDRTRVTHSCFFPKGDLDLESMRRLAADAELESDVDVVVDDFRAEFPCKSNFESDLDLCEAKVSGRGLTSECATSIVGRLLRRCSSDEGTEDACVKVSLTSLTRIDADTELHWYYDQVALVDCALHFQSAQMEYAIKAAIVDQTLTKVKQELESKGDVGEGVFCKPYRSLFKDSVTPLPRGYLTKGYDNYLDYIYKRRAQESWKK